MKNYFHILFLSSLIMLLGCKGKNADNNTIKEFVVEDNSFDLDVSNPESGVHSIKATRNPGDTIIFNIAYFENNSRHNVLTRVLYSPAKLNIEDKKFNQSDKYLVEVGYFLNNQVKSVQALKYYPKKSLLEKSN